MKNNSAINRLIHLFTILIALTTVVACGKTNSLEGKHFYNYIHQGSSHRVSSFSVTTNNITELKLSFTKDSVEITTEKIYNSVNLPEALQSRVRKSCSSLRYKYTVTGNKLMIAEAGDAETSFQLLDGDLIFEDGTYFYSVPIEQLSQKLQVDRIQKVAGLNTKDAQSVLKHCIECN